MTTKSLLFIGVAAALSLQACSSPQASTKAAERVAPIKVATWNMEHFTYPLNAGCRPRSEAELTAMKAYIAKVDADVYGVEEVASEQALRQLFPEDSWQIVFSARPDSDVYECRGSGFTSTQQKVAIVSRKTLPIESASQFSALSVGNPGLRYGVEARISTPMGPVDVLTVHMKSGCFVSNYHDKESKACNTLETQSPVLIDWISAHEKSDTPYLIMGDFNHQLGETDNALKKEILQSVGSASSLRLVTEDMVGCHPRYPKPIDHIFIGGKASEKWAIRTAVHNFEDMSEAAMLSDHCAVSVTVSQ